jgi:hypothetical protein
MKLTEFEIKKLINEEVAKVFAEAKINPRIFSNRSRFPNIGSIVAFLRKDPSARFLGEGSSRTVYAIDSKRVLKIAINEKGLGQNKAEMEISTDSRTGNLYAKILDYDPNFEWLVSELVKPLVSGGEFENLTGCSWSMFRAFLSELFGLRKITLEQAVANLRTRFGEESEKQINDCLKNPWFLSTIKGLRNTELLSGDLTLIDHWGKTPQQNVVLLDYGFTEDVYQRFYEDVRLG